MLVGVQDRAVVSLMVCRGCASVGMGVVRFVWMLFSPSAYFDVWGLGGGDVEGLIAGSVIWVRTCRMVEVSSWVAIGENEVWLILHRVDYGRFRCVSGVFERGVGGFESGCWVGGYR